MHPYISVVQVNRSRFFTQWLNIPIYHFSFAPGPQILSFILIRNIPGYVRSIYSSFFAWFGKISLEVRWLARLSVSSPVAFRLHPSWFWMLCLPQLFICQYHIWLAADTKGILVLIPGNPSLNILVSSFIFVCVAHEISLITNDLAQVVIPKDSMALLKRLAAMGLLSLAALLLTRGAQPAPGA